MLCYPNSGVSFQDVMVRQGVTEAPPKTPFILGFECAGIVAAVADDVENIKVKDPLSLGLQLVLSEALEMHNVYSQVCMPQTS